MVENYQIYILGVLAVIALIIPMIHPQTYRKWIRQLKKRG